MKIDSSLKANSAVHDLRKGGYQLAPYRVIKHKGKWTAEADQTDFFSGSEHFARSDRKSFLLVAEDGDTLVVNSGVVRQPVGKVKRKTGQIEFYKDGFIGFGREKVWVRIVRNTALASFHFKRDSTPWHAIMTLTAPEDEESSAFDDDATLTLRFISKKEREQIKKSFELMEGWLSNGRTDITMRAVTVREDGSTPKLLPFLGFEFLIEEQVVAAIDMNLPWMGKKSVRFHHDLDPQTRMVIAAAMIWMSL